MPKVTLDLTGAGGLVSKFAGDLNSTSASPQLRYLSGPGQMADGIYDPLRVEGYMSPANNTFSALTGTIANKFVAEAYSPNVDTIYLAQNGTVLSTLSGLAATSITNNTILTENSTFKDIEMYSINDQESVLYTYLNNTPSTSSTPNLNLGFKATNSARGLFQISAKVFESLPEDETFYELISSYANQKLAQSFSTRDFATLPTYDVSGIRVRLNMPFVGSTQVWTLKCGIQTDSGGFPSGTYVTNASVTMDPANLPQGVGDYVYFTFSQTVTLTANTQYHIVVEPTVFGDLGANEGVEWLRTIYNNGIYQTSRQSSEYNNGSGWSRTTAAPFDTFDFALILNQYSYVGRTQPTDLINPERLTGNNYGAGVTTLSVTQYTTSTDNPIIIVSFEYNNTVDKISSVTCDGVAMTQQDNFSDGTNRLNIFYKTGVAIGSHTIVVNLSAAQNLAMFTAAYYGVDGTTPINGGSHGTSGAAGSISVSTTTPVANSFIAGFFRGSANTLYATNSNTFLRSSNATATNDGYFDKNIYQATAGSYSLDVSATGAPVTWSYSVFSMAPANVSGQPTLPAIIQADTNTFLHSAQNGFLYWFTGNRVHKFDGSVSGGDAGTFGADVLLFPSYFKAVDATDYNSLLYIAIETTNVSNPTEARQFPDEFVGVYSWDYLSILSTIRNFSPCPGARNIKRIFLNADGDIRVITVGGNGFTEIRALQNGNFDVIFTLGLQAYPERRDSFSYVDQMCVWVGVDGNTYALGRPYKGAKEGIFKIGTITGQKGGADSLTPLITVAGNNNSSQSLDGLLIAYTTTTSGTDTHNLIRWYPHGTGTISSVAQKPNAGAVYTPVVMFPTLAKINYIRVYHAPVGSTSTTVKGTIDTFVNQSTTRIRTDNVTSADIIKGYQYLKVGQALQNAGVFALQIKMNWSTSQTLDTTADWMPRFLEVDYEEITKLF